MPSADDRRQSSRRETGPTTVSPGCVSEHMRWDYLPDFYYYQGMLSLGGYLVPTAFPKQEGYIPTAPNGGMGVISPYPMPTPAQAYVQQGCRSRLPGRGGASVPSDVQSAPAMTPAMPQVMPQSVPPMPQPMPQGAPQVPPMMPAWPFSPSTGPRYYPTPAPAPAPASTPAPPFGYEGYTNHRRNNHNPRPRTMVTRAKDKRDALPKPRGDRKDTSSQDDSAGAFATYGPLWS